MINTRESREDSVLWPLGTKLWHKTWSPIVWWPRLEVEEQTLRQLNQRANNNRGEATLSSNRMLRILAKICQTKWLQAKWCHRSRRIRISSFQAKFLHIKTCISKWWDLNNNKNHPKINLNRQSFLPMAKSQILNHQGEPNNTLTAIQTTDSHKKEEIRVTNKSRWLMGWVTIENNLIDREGGANQTRMAERGARIWGTHGNKMCQIRREQEETAATVAKKEKTKDLKKIIGSCKIGESSGMNSMGELKRLQAPLIKAIMWSQSRKFKKRTDNKKKREQLSSVQSKEKPMRRKTQHLQIHPKKRQKIQRIEHS